MYFEVAFLCMLIEGVLLLRIWTLDKEKFVSPFSAWVLVAILFSAIDTLWGLAYLDVFGLGTFGIKIASYGYFLFYCYTSWTWFLYVEYLQNSEHKMSRKKKLISAFPMFFILAICIANVWTNCLFSVGGTSVDYHRESFYPVVQVCINSYFIYMIAYLTIKLSVAKSQEEKKNLRLILMFCIFPFAIGFLQFFSQIRPYASMSYAVAVLIIFAFIYVQNREDGLRKESQEEISKNKLQQEAIIEALAYGFSAYQIVDWDTEEYIDSAVSVERLRQISEDIVACKTYSRAVKEVYEKFIPPKRRKEALELLSIKSVKAILEKQKQYTVTIPTNCQNNLKYTQMTFTLLENKIDTRKSFIISHRDVTQSFAKEYQREQTLSNALIQAEKANRAKTVFLNNMSHDIRTPMNAVVGFAALAQKHIMQPEKAIEDLKKVEMSSQHMLQIINDILDMAKIDSGKVELDTEKFDLEEVVKNIDDMFRTSMEEKGLVYHVEQDLKCRHVYGDKLHINQIIINLASNALKYTHPGGEVWITILLSETDEDGTAEFKVSVRDTGIGISEEFKKHIFEEFERERSTTVTGIQGTGLGLAISKKLTDLMGGKLECKSNLGEGTEFIFSLRMKVVEEKKEESLSNVIEVDFSNRRVLLVEDNMLNREIAKEFLEEYGFVVEEAEDGSIAVDKVRVSHPKYYDLILMDIQMPYMDGYMATKEIRNLKNAELAAVPIVAMSANAFEEDKKKAIQVGMNGYITKPIDCTKMTETIQMIFA